MSALAIQAKGIGKRYRRGALAPSGLLRDTLAGAFRSPGKIFRRDQFETFWALKDVSLDVREGEVLGLIGRNGSGKTTLLKILSRITRPTEGWAEIHGRVGSLLEVGTGFHPELTGRENTYLSGAILGMGKAEIARKFDEIVAFAELEKFIDTPVKHYSSGMYVRLAFAVAAHLEPEILLVDEVLAVGDIRFQKKCLGKMGDVARAGRTVVLVSHNMAAINLLSSRVILLNNGSIEFNGPTAEATARYYTESLEGAETGASIRNFSREGNGKARFTAVSIQPLSAEGEFLKVAQPGCNLDIQVQLECVSRVSDANLALVFYDMNGLRVIDTNTAQKGEFVSIEAGEKLLARFVLYDVLLKPGKYLVGLWLGRHGMELIDHVEHAITLEIAEHEVPSKHLIDFPGIYLCRFEKYITISNSSS
jgi:lipopolysaccharide transport system ATP-binding protein